MPPKRRDRRSDEPFADEGNEPTSHRDRFAQDRDRILYCAEFRRLAGVTQVVNAGEGPSFHNRLTHSIKVGQVGRRLTEFISKKDKDDLEELEEQINPEVVEAACLAHDIGHPPFGHAAETALQSAIAHVDSFEGNAQSFRILTFLSARRGNPLGLDLTRATLNAILKYPTLRVDNTVSKWSAYQDDREAFDYARQLCDAGDKRQSIEAALMDWSDDVSYATHDLEDFFRAGIIPLDQLLAGPALAELVEVLGTKWKKKPGKKKGWAEAANFGQRVEGMFSELAALFPSLKRPFMGRRDQEAALHKLTGRFLDRYLNSYNGQRPIKLNTDPNAAARVDRNPDAEFEVSLLKDVTAHFVFESPTLLAQQDGQKLIVAKLFEVFHEALGPGGRPQLIPPSFAHLVEWCQADAPVADRRRARAAADIVSSLTEEQAHRLYLRLTGISPGTIHDPIVR